MRALGVLVVVVVAAGLGLWFALARRQVEGPISTRPPMRRDVPMTTSDDGARIQKGCTDLALSIRAALSRGGAIPESTRLRRLTLSENGECEVELSTEFLGVNERGSTGESEAQNALRSALAPFDRVTSMTLVVDGAVFEGSHGGEWQGIAVRGGNAGTDPDQ